MLGLHHSPRTLHTHVQTIQNPSDSSLSYLDMPSCTAPSTWNNLPSPFLWTEMYLPPDVYIEALTPDVTAFGDKALKEVIKVKWGLKVGPQSCRTDVLRIRNTWAWGPPSPLLPTPSRQKKGPWGTKWTSTSGKWGFTRNQPCWHFDFQLPAPKTVKKNFSV